jgi:hypothetical protein
MTPDYRDTEKPETYCPELKWNPEPSGQLKQGYTRPTHAGRPNTQAEQGYRDLGKS